MPTPQTDPNSLIVSVGVQCDVGKERTENQDRVSRAATPFGDMFVVADGVGGYKGGAQAAQSVVDGFASYLKAHGNLPLQEALQSALRSISVDIQERSSADTALRGMGSTVVLCIVKGNRLTYAHVGDSRLYLIRDRKLQQLTRDHSVMERLISQGMLTPAQAKDHPEASVLTRAIGQSLDVALDIAEITLQPNDALLLCSDGLWGYAKYEEIEAIATSSSLSASAVASALLNLALEGGGGDNISIQFLRFEAGRSPKSAGVLLGMPRNRALAAMVLTLLIGGGTGAAFYWNNTHSWTDNIPIVPTTTSGQPKQSPKKTSSADGKEKPVNPQPAKPESKNQTQPTKTSVAIIKSEDGSVVKWASDLTALSFVVTSKQNGNDDCLSLARSAETLFYTHEKADVAKNIQQSIASHPAIAEMTFDDIKQCGNVQMVAMPAIQSSTAEKITDKAKNAANKVKNGAEAGYDALKKKTEEIEKSTGKFPPQP